MIVNVKPMSVNKAWQGRRFKTNDYKTYEKELLMQLPQFRVPKGEKTLRVVFGVSSKLADLDNCLKLFIDVLCKKYDFDDREIYEIQTVKENVKKGEEYIDFNVVPYKGW